MDSTASKVQKLNIQKSRRHNRATKRTNRRTHKKQKDGRTYFRTDGRTNEQTNKRTNARCVPLYAACSTSLSSHSYTVISFLSFGHIIPSHSILAKERSQVKSSQFKSRDMVQPQSSVSAVIIPEPVRRMREAA